MPIAYLDTNALIKLVLQEDEEGERKVQEIIQRTGRICTCVITYAEARATISRHFRELQQAGSEVDLEQQHREVIADFSRLWEDVNLIEVTRPVYLRAGDLTVAHPGLRGMDSLHLAAALEVRQFEELSFLTFDQVLRTAAIALLGTSVY